VSITNLDRIFHPQRVAVIGASDNPQSVGYAVLRNLIGAFGGVVYPVNPKRESVQGIAAYPSIDKLPHPADLAVIATPAPTVKGIVRQCGEAGTRGLAVLSAGFGEAGPDGRALEAELLAEARRFPGMRMIGPNCLGVIVPPAQLNAAFTVGMPPRGNLAFISQSGALGTSVLDWAIRKNIGFSAFVSVGNMADVGFADLIDYFGQDERTDAILLYIESIRQARRFVSAARAFTKNKPIIAYKAGRFAQSAAAAASHTGALMGADDVHDAAFRRCGIERVFDFEDMFDCAELLSRGRLPRSGSRLAIVTNAGGPGVMATDAVIAADGQLAALSPATIEQLNAALPPCWSHGNPVDVLGDATPVRYADTVRLVLHDPGVDALLVILTPQAMTDPQAVAEALIAVAGGSRKPVVTAWVGGNAVVPARELLNASGLPAYSTPERAVDGLMHLVRYARNIELLYEMPREVETADAFDQEALHLTRAHVLGKPNHTLDEIDAKRLLATAGIPVASPEPAANAQRAVELAADIGFPVVMKIHSPDITHKTDVGGVALDLKDEQEVQHAFDAMMRKVRAAAPDARIDGVTLQPMIDTRHSVEIILGAKRDPVFGSVILVGSGGTTAELWQDRVLGLPPLTASLVTRMLESLKVHRLLHGYRDRPAVDADALVETIIRFSYLIAESPNIAEVDINPLLVSPTGVIGLDARIITNDGPLEPDASYSHLAMRPYPHKLVRPFTMDDGTAVTLRPIRPEDEPLWHGMIAASSPQTKRARFQAMIGKTTHRFAARYCHIDYDREMAIVAIDTQGDQPRMLGVGRLVMGPADDEAEYAVLIADPWQGQGLGSALTEYCLHIARGWGVSRVYAATDADNKRMIAVFKEQGFEVDIDLPQSLANATCAL